MWQPIETAPRDGETYIVGVAGKIAAFACIWDAELDKWLTLNGTFEREFEKEFQPKWWTPLPQSQG